MRMQQIFWIHVLCGYAKRYVVNERLDETFQGHKYLRHTVQGYATAPRLLPAGEWRVDSIVHKTINGIKEIFLQFHDYFEVTPTDALEF